MNYEVYPREGVSLFIAGHTVGWGYLEFRRNGEVVEGVAKVDTQEGFALVYARDAKGTWPIFYSSGLPIVYEVRGNWTVHEVHPANTEFDKPEYVQFKKDSQQRCAARRKGEDTCCQD